MGGNKIVMFKCEWWDVNNPGKGIMIDEYGWTLVNVICKLKSNKPFVLTCQVEQVFNMKNIKNPLWQFVVKTEPRNYYNMPPPKDEKDDEEEDIIQEPYQQNASHGYQLGSTSDLDNNDDIISWNRNDIPCKIVDMDDVDKD